MRWRSVYETELNFSGPENMRLRVNDCAFPTLAASGFGIKPDRRCSRCFKVTQSAYPRNGTITGALTRRSQSASYGEGNE